jgi:hypothetical protein
MLLAVPVISPILPLQILRSDTNADLPGRAISGARQSLLRSAAAPRGASYTGGRGLNGTEIRRAWTRPMHARHQIDQEAAFPLARRQGQIVLIASPPNPPSSGRRQKRKRGNPLRPILKERLK